MAPTLRIGVDVGGTNTDGVILDLSQSSEPNKGIIAWKKLSTTANPSDGINDVIKDMFAQSNVNPNDVASVTIGTTHFINAVVEMNEARLAEVAVIRLCGPFSKDIPIGIDWPPRLRNIICRYRGLVNGGLEIDGSLIAELDVEEVKRQCDIIKSQGIKNIAVVGIFSPIDVFFQQEETAAAIIGEVYAEADVVCSKDVANIGFLERENAAILNASILPFARRTIHSFQNAVSRLELKCPVFVTQNDGTILPASMAARLPIRTFSSGPTNSMRGAAFLIQDQEKEAMVVVDIGGTTTDVGILQKNGFPRQAASYSNIAGVRTNFSYPDVRSIGLGGGSIVRREKSGELVVGPESVGYEITKKALLFGGSIATATDYTVLADQNLMIGEPTNLIGSDIANNLREYKLKVKAMLERIIDTMKTSPDDIPVVLVGGGAVIAPDSLSGASKVVKPMWADVANAIGAATARVSGVVDSVESTETKTKAQVMEVLSKRAVDKAVTNGALRETVTIAEMESYPLQYIANKSRIIIKAVGDFDYSRTNMQNELLLDGPIDETWNGLDMPAGNKAKRHDESHLDHSVESIVYTKDYIMGYKPEVVDREWLLSETDLEFITIGCYILGTGGGGNPYQHFLRLREMKRAGAVLRVISPRDLKDGDIVACGGAKGSPQVSIEKPYGDEILESQRELYAFLKKTPDAVIPLEIGGGNGLQGLIIGASTAMNIPAIDGDWMGRAYPVSWQTTPVVYEKKAMMIPTCISDGNGRIIFMTKAPTELDAERALRAALSQMGSHVGCAKGPVSGENTKKWVIENTMSLAWRIGRAVILSRCTKSVDTVAESIIAEVGGSDSALVLFKGKIIGVERVLKMGHAYGEVIIESTAEDSSLTKERMVIPFKNENIYARIEDANGKSKILAMVPDLVCVLDAQNGEALGTQEYRYGLAVLVLGITASEKWTSTERGLEIGGPKGFGFDDLEYKPLVGGPTASDC
ncbi:hydantoinase protein [Stemphylium lycopersici]|uniref:Hydantoinase protein n=1 Tax=Stemphylium lycopersici TaxID=183478 RepID=A0A364MVQ4_STELY|nr:hydantoinase protein [Stemphylium lycopersici]RAR01140.1 hydantoinase protein [Stemphylium lycopersici]RAR04767.1 hydantoinase protein [Stemphylium lycopersici]